MGQLLYQEITKKIIGAAFEVHTFLGNGSNEVVYHRALSWELDQVGLQYVREYEQEIYYKYLSDSIGKCRVDFEAKSLEFKRLILT